jgi:hypothetical protein
LAARVFVFAGPHTGELETAIELALTISAIAAIAMQARNLTAARVGARTRADK